MKRWITVSFVCAAIVVASHALPRAQGTPTDGFFDDSTVHSINLEINEKDWQTLRQNYLDNSYYPCNFIYNGTTVRNIGVRSRGTGSRSGTKPGLRVDFDHY